MNNLLLSLAMAALGQFGGLGGGIAVGPGGGIGVGGGPGLGVRIGGYPGGGWTVRSGPDSWVPCAAAHYLDGGRRAPTPGPGPGPARAGAGPRPDATCRT